MSLNTFIGLILFAVLALAVLPLSCCRRPALWLLQRLLQGGLMLAVAGCALFHTCPGSVPRSLAVPVEVVVEKLQDDMPVLRVARAADALWLALVALLVLASLPLLSWIDRARAAAAPCVEEHGSAADSINPANPGPASPCATERSPTLETTPPGVRPGLVVLRGEKPNVAHLLHEGRNVIGRDDKNSVDVDLSEQESSDRVWCSREHAGVYFMGGRLFIKDLDSVNGTFVNRVRLAAGQVLALNREDVVRVGSVQLQVRF